MLYDTLTSVDRTRTLFFIILVAGATALLPTYRALAEDPAKPSDAAPVPSVETPEAVPADTVEADPSITLRGSVWRTKAGIVFLKTPVGLLTLSSKTTLKDLKASQDVSFWMHERQMVVEIRKKTDGSLVHRYLSGPMTPGTDATKTLRWWTPQGEVATHFGTQEERLASYREGDALTVEVDDANTIIGVHDLQFDLQIGQVPPSGSDASVRLSGTVSKLKSNFVFVRTPVGVVMVNAKIGLPHVKVGQPMTLHIDHARVAVELGPAKPTAPRASATQPGSTSPMP